MSFAYAGYLMCKPFHSFMHKRLKREAACVARENDLYNLAVAEVAEYTSADKETVEKRLQELLAQAERQKFEGLTENELRDFYSNDKRFLYELPLWNAGSGRSYMLERIIGPYLYKNKHKMILDFGAGTGDFCVTLAEKGFQTFYFDINLNLARFAAWRFKRKGVVVSILSEQQLYNMKFDCLVTFDVFEHFKNLPDKIKQLSGLLNKGGSLIFNIELSGDGMHLAENKQYADDFRLDKILRCAGLYFVWKFKGFYFYKKR